MSPAQIAALILEALRAGHEIKAIIDEVQGQATPEEWTRINSDLDAAVEAWRKA